MTESASQSDQERRVEECQGLVRTLARQVKTRMPSWIEMDDLISYGQVGLLQAARDFDPSKNVKFSTFAFYRIRGAIFDGVNKLMWFKAVRDPETKYEQMANSLIPAKMNESPPADVKTADGLVREASWFHQIAGSLAVVYLVAVDNEGQSTDVVDQTTQAPWSELVRDETSKALRDAIDELPSDAAALIRAVYFEDRTLQEAADRLGISKSWASRVHSRALEQMARFMRQNDFERATD